MVYSRSPWLNKECKQSDVENAEYLQMRNGRYAIVGGMSVAKRKELCRKEYGNKVTATYRISV